MYTKLSEMTVCNILFINQTYINYFLFKFVIVLKKHRLKLNSM